MIEIADSPDYSLLYPTRHKLLKYAIQLPA